MSTWGRNPLDNRNSNRAPFLKLPPNRNAFSPSGYWGPWTNAESTFSNEYFRLLVEEKWTIKTTHEGKK